MVSNLGEEFLSNDNSQPQIKAKRIFPDKIIKERKRAHLTQDSLNICDNHQESSRILNIF